MLVSIIITTKNEEKNIENCLRSINKQSFPTKNIEIIVVDNHSTDKTLQIARAYTSHIFTKGPERSAQRNYGIEKSRGDYILYLDADMVLSKRCVEESVKLVQKNSYIAALYIPEIVTGTSFWSRVRQFERSFYDGTVIDCVRFVKRAAFDNVNGFDETMSGPEDWDFDKKIRAKYETSLIESPIYHNESEFNMKKYLSKKGYYAKSFNTYIKKWGSSDPDLKKQLGLWYRFIGVFIEERKWKRLLFNPILTTGVFILRILVGIVYIKTKISHR